MRTRLLALAALAPLLLVAVARADDDDPYEATPPAKDLPPLPPLPDLPPLPELLPLGTLHEPEPPRATLAGVNPRWEPLAPTLLTLPAVPAAVLGQYDEYKRPLAAYSVDADPVSVPAYERCVGAGKCTKPACVSPRPDGRVTCVDLAQAKAYCAFARERLPTEDEWEHAARQSGNAGMQSIDDAAEWTASPYCFYCGKDDQVVRGGPARNPGLRGWRPPTTHDASVGFRCAK